MAAALQCELCGGKLMGKPGGIFECDSCGMEYSTEWAKAKIQEIKGTVKVEGTVQVAGTVKVDGSAGVDNLLKRGWLALEDKQWERAIQHFDDALNLNAECSDAYLGKCCAREKVAGVDAILKNATQGQIERILKAYDFQNALRFATSQRAAELRKKMDDAILADLERRERAKTELAAVRKRIAPVQHMLGACGLMRIECLQSDGTVLIWRPVSGGLWKTFKQKTDQIAISGSRCLYSDGTVHGEDVKDWKNIVAIHDGYENTVGLKSDGTVVAVGENKYGQCDVADWRSIVAICTSGNHTVGLQSNGKVVAVGQNQYGKCNVKDWKDIVAVCAGSNHTVGLHSDGTVVAVGNNDHGQCNVENWRNIVAIDAGGTCTIGLRADGTVVYVGYDRSSLCGIENWHDIVAIKTEACTVGLQSDGTVVTNDKTYTANWKLFNNLETVEEEQKAAVERRRNKIEKELRILEQESIEWETKCAKRIDDLNMKKAELNTELSNLKGLFTGKQRKEIEAKLSKVNRELKEVEDEVDDTRRRRSELNSPETRRDLI